MKKGDGLIWNTGIKGWVIGYILSFLIGRSWMRGQRFHWSKGQPVRAVVGVADNVLNTVARVYSGRTLRRLLFIVG